MNLRQRTIVALLGNAVLSPLSGLILAAAIVLVGVGVRVPVLDLPPAFWLVPLVPVWLAVVGVRLFSRTAGETVTAPVLREAHDLDQIAHTHLRDIVRRATAYRERIDQTAGQARALAPRLQDVSNQVEQWVGGIYTLAQKVDAYRNNTLIHMDLKTLPQSIGQLKIRMGEETDASVKAELGTAIRQRQAQLDLLEALDNTMERAELQLENTLTALGTVYSQMLLIDARDVNTARTQRLSDSISEHVAGLNDVMASMAEVYDSQPARAAATSTR